MPTSFPAICYLFLSNLLSDGELGGQSPQNRDWYPAGCTELLELAGSILPIFYHWQVSELAESEGGRRGQQRAF